jgi:hypothetical protein
LDGGPDKYKVVNISDRPLYDVLIARSTAEGRRLAWIDVLPPTKLVPPGAAPNPNQPKPEGGGKPALDLFSDTNKNAQAAADAELRAAVKKLKAAGNAQAAAEVRAAMAKAEAADLARAQAAQAQAQAIGARGEPPVPVAVVPSPEAATARPPVLFGRLPAATIANAVEVTLSEPLAVLSPESAAKTTQALAERLAKAGLSAHEAESFVDHYRALVFEGQALVVACRLDAAVMDEKIPLSVFPAPAKIVRVGVVLLRNADPQLGQEVDKLIAQLGDPKFSLREAAHERIVEMGPLAFVSLNKAVNHSDPEIAIRCERILLSQGQQLGAQSPPQQGNRVIFQNGVAVPVAPRAR